MGAALSRVMGNKGAPGIDGMHVEELPLFLKVNGEELKVKLLLGDYKPEAVRGVEIPKPNGGKRLLGIPTVVDRFIQQCVLHC